GLPIWSCSRWGLPCRPVARLAVRSYRTVSPLPDPDPPCGVPGHRRSALCCTFRRLAPPRRYLAPCPVEPGLSSACLRMTRLSGRLRGDVFYGFAVRIPHALLKQSAGPANLHLQSPAAAAAAPLTKGAWGERSGGKEGRTCICVPGRGACSGVTRFRSAAAPPGAGDLRPLLQPCTQPRLTPRGRRRRAPCAGRR